MTEIRIKICRQTGPYGRVPQKRFWFAPNCEWSIIMVGATGPNPLIIHWARPELRVGRKVVLVRLGMESIMEFAISLRM